MTDDGMVVLVTGAAGLLGAEVTARLAEAGHHVIAMAHHTQELVRNNGTPIRTVAHDRPKPGTVSVIAGDVTAAGLGLSSELWHKLSTGLDRIVHCAAITGFGHPDSRYQAVNLDGTANVLALARSRKIPLVHVSTAYVCGERRGLIAEHELDVGQRLANAYEDSKLQAETLVRKAQADGLAATIVRPSIVTGAERTGVVREFKNLYVVLKLVAEGKVRTIPGNYNACLDLVPVDYVADLVTAAAIRFAEANGQTFHAVGGALTLRDVSDVLAEFPSCQVPRFVPSRSFDLARLAASEQAYHARIVSLYESYFRRDIRFDTTAARRFSRRKAPACGPRYLRRLIDHCFATGYLGDPLPGVAEVLGGLATRGERT
ncbi:hypothetical protein DMH04_26800 [Kibdelosporangium aridum]|uniref:Thioester reductase (TE) domain-containing protein n=1 Tax=Kibdelosporangium aridum TaxID=2030 RepID=A0A428Z5A5_KIBAR|nr:SDR family oxidoreductase [Kibdelosporangium aridum]RSM81958.1 hypothetical protein DMH04_26800 [Kibdelosporangium aridum]